MIERFENDGWPSSYLSAYNYDSSQSNRTNAEKEVKPHVEELLKATRAEKVDIIAHSMGSLSTRWYTRSSAAKQRSTIGCLWPARITARSWPTTAPKSPARRCAPARPSSQS
jgi:triacylglycerol esterase/lipase EstA (alpha/beta hydrolase family)